MAAGVALAAAVEQVAGIAAGLKWPNDLVVDDRKLAGLLAEADGDALRGRRRVQRELGGVPRGPGGDRHRLQPRGRSSRRSRRPARRVPRPVRSGAGGGRRGASTTTGPAWPPSGARCASSTSAATTSSAPRSASPTTGALVVRDDARPRPHRRRRRRPPPPLTRLNPVLAWQTRAHRGFTTPKRCFGSGVEVLGDEGVERGARGWRRRGRGPRARRGRRRAEMGCTSRVVEVRKASSASRSASSGSGCLVDRDAGRVARARARARASRRAGSPTSPVGVATTPSRTTNTLEPVASHSSSRVLAKIASLAPRSCAYASARTFSAYDVVFRPAVAPRSLRTHGTTTTRTESGHGRNGLLATTTVGPAVAALRAERRDAAGDRDAQAGLVVAVRPRARAHGRAQRSSPRSGTGRPRPGGGVREPVEVAGPRERLAAVHADGLEHAVAHEQPVVERRDAGVGDGDAARRRPTRASVDSALTKLPASPPAPRRPRPRSRRAAFSSVSAHSASGRESATMPPPTENCVQPVPGGPRTVKVRMATARSAVTRRGRRPTCRSSPSAPQ